MFHLHVHAGAPEPAREEVKLGDGQLLAKVIDLAVKYGPLVAALLGVKLPPLPDLSGIKATAEDKS